MLKQLDKEYVPKWRREKFNEYVTASDVRRIVKEELIRYGVLIDKSDDI